MRIGSLFSGIGGIELGFKRAGGFKTEWFVENDVHSQFILRKHWPNAQIYGDITQIDFNILPRVDVLTGGFPCQDISNAGKRAGIEGSRSSLWKHYLRAICEVRPRYALIENVAALRGRGLDVVLCDLAEVGYDAEWHIISAASVGAPHRRDRVFILAIRTENVAHSFGEREGACVESSNGEWKGEECSCSESARTSSDVANSECDRITKRDRKEEFGGKKESECSNKLECSGWWATEPDVGRVADGISLRVDRIKRLGNAVVPRCAEIFAKAIKEYEASR